jgi:hypothetical protein
LPGAAILSPAGAGEYQPKEQAEDGGGKILSHYHKITRIGLPQKHS